MSIIHLLESDITDLCKLLATVRKQKKIKQGVLAEKVNITQSYLSLVERGLKIPSFGILLKIVKALDVQVQVKVTI